MNKIEKAMMKFEQTFGNGFFEIIPVKTFKGKKEEACYYHNMTIHINTNGFEPADIYHEAAHAMDELIFETGMEFAKFFSPFYKQMKKMPYFREFMDMYESADQPSECFAEAIAMSIEHPEWEIGQQMIKAIQERI